MSTRLEIVVSYTPAVANARSEFVLYLVHANFGIVGEDLQPSAGADGAQELMVARASPQLGTYDVVFCGRTNLLPQPYSARAGYSGVYNAPAPTPTPSPSVTPPPSTSPPSTAPPPPDPPPVPGNQTTDAYFAEGTTRPGFFLLYTLINAESSAIRVDVTVSFADGAPPLGGFLTIQPQRLVGLLPSEDPDIGVGRDVSFRFHSSRPFTVARTVFFDRAFDGTGVVRDYTTSRGSDNFGTDWLFAEGSSLPGFQEYLTVQNPTPQTANLRLTFGFEGSPPKTASLIVRGLSRTTIAVSDSPFGGGGQQGISVQVRSTNGVPVVVERPMYFARDLDGSGRVIDGGHVVTGLLPSTRHFFAEGTLIPNWHEYLTLFNPHTEPAMVKARYLLESANPIEKSYSVPGGARRTVEVFNGGADHGVGRNASLTEGRGVSVELTADRPIAAERVLYTSGTIGDVAVNGGHVAGPSGGVTACADFALASTVGKDASFITVANPTDAEQQVSVQYFAARAGGAKFLFRNVPPRQRATIDMRDGPANVFVGVRVLHAAHESGQKASFVAELPLYLNIGPAEFDEFGAGVLQPRSCG